MERDFIYQNIEETVDKKGNKYFMLVTKD